MMKRKEFMLGAVAGLTLAAAATAGGVIDWPTAEAGPVAGKSGRLTVNPGAAPNFAPPQGAPLSFADIFQQVAPAVVQIEVTTRIDAPGRGFIQIPGLGSIPVPTPEDGEGREGRGAGSGFFISGDGFIVTNNHVVENAEDIQVKLSDGRELAARLVGRDPDTDLAVIKVEGSDFPFVDFEETAEPRVGDWVIAVGNPFGLGGTATAGIVSGLGRDVPQARNPYTDFLQIDAAINSGNSGGPTFDIYGRVIGVNSSILAGASGGSIGIGFAIPSKLAKDITGRLMRGESIERGYLGAEIGDLAPDYRQALGLPDDLDGAYVNLVTPDGPADRAGLRAGDVVLSINGESVEGSSDLTRRVAAAEPGDNLRLVIIREERRQTLDVRSGTRPADINGAGGRNLPDDSVPGADAEDSGPAVEGLSLAPLSATIRERYNLSSSSGGALITAVDPSSRAAREGLQPGMIILQANSRSVTSANEFGRIVAAARAAGRPSVLLLVRIPQGNRPVVLPLTRR